MGIFEKIYLLCATLCLGPAVRVRLRFLTFAAGGERDAAFGLPASLRRRTQPEPPTGVAASVRSMCSRVLLPPRRRGRRRRGPYRESHVKNRAVPPRHVPAPTSGRARTHTHTLYARAELVYTNTKGEKNVRKN